MTHDIKDERMRRWQLSLGDEMAGLSDRDRRMGAALSALYDVPRGSSKGGGRKGGLGASSPRVSKRLGDIREFFPASVVQVIQKDAFDRLDLKALMMEPEFIQMLEPDVRLVADLISLRRQMPAKTMETARVVVAKELLKRLRTRRSWERPRERSGPGVRGLPTSTGTARSRQTSATGSRNTARSFRKSLSGVPDAAACRRISTT